MKHSYKLGNDKRRCRAGDNSGYVAYNVAAHIGKLRRVADNGNTLLRALYLSRGKRVKRTLLRALHGGAYHIEKYINRNDDKEQ